MADLSALIEISADASGVETGIGSAKKSIAGFKSAVVEAGSVTSAALEKSGDGGTVAAKKVENATNNIVGSIQRQIAVTEAGSKSGAEYYRVLASQRGVDVNALKPYLDQLDAVKAKQIAATGALTTAAPALEKVGISAAQTANALRGVPAQFTDIVTSLQGGQKPLTVLLQQGGQLKDMFGGVGNAARALGGYVLGLVNPFTLAAAVVGGLGLAFFLGAKEAQEYNKAIILSGNAVGATAGQLQGYAQAISTVTGTQGAAAAALAEFVQFGKVGGESLQAFTQAALKFEKATGTAVSETVKQFAELGKAPVEASIKLNEQINFLTVDLFKQIKALEDQGKATEAAALAQKSFADVLSSRSGQIIQNVGLIERAWLAVKSAISGAANAALSIGRAPSQKDLVDDKRTQVSALEGLIQSGSGGAETVARRQAALELRKQELNVLTESERVIRRSVESQADGAAKNKAGIEFIQQGNKFISEKQKLEQDITQTRNLGIAAGLSEEAIQKRIADIRAKANKGGSKTGGAAPGENEVASLQARIALEGEFLTRLKERGLQAEKLTFFEEASAKFQKQLEGSISGVTRAAKEKALAIAQSGIAQEKEVAALQKQLKLIADAKNETLKQVEAVDKAGESTRQQASDQEAANAVFGKAKTAIQEYRLEELKRQAAMADSSDSFSPAYVAALNNQVEAQERYVESLKKADFKALNESLNEASRNLDATAKAYSDEANNAFLVGVEREKINVLRKAEIGLAKQLAEIDRSGVQGSEKQILVDKANAISQREIGVETSRVIREDFQKTSEAIGSSITDALLRGFESGKGFAKNFRDTVVNLFKTLVLKPTIQGIVGTVTGGVSGLANAATGGGASSLGSIGNLASLGSNVSTLFGAATGAGLGATVSGIVGTTVSALSGAGVIAGNAAIAGSLGLGAGSAAAAATAAAAAGGTAVTAGVAAAAGSAATLGATLAAVAGPVGIAIAAIALGIALFKKNGTPSQSTGSLARSFDANGNITSSKSNFAEGNGAAVVDGLFATFKGLQTALGGKGGAGFDYGSFSGNDNKNPQFRLGSAGFDSGEIALNDANFGTAAARAVLAALKASELPASIAKKLNGLVPAELSGDQIQAATTQIIEYAANIRLLGTQLEALPFKNLIGVSFDARAALVDLSGGVEKFTGNLTGYFQNFYSAEEQRQQKIKDINTATAGTGLDAATATRAEFRALFEALDITTDSGQKSAAALLSVQEAFASLTPAIGTTVTILSEAMKRFTTDRANLEADLLDAKGDPSGAVRARRAIATEGLTGFEIAAFDYNQSLRDQIATVQAATQASKNADQERTGLQDQINGLTDTAAQALARQRGALDESNRALFDQVKAATAAAAATAAFTTAMDGLSNTRVDLQAQLLTLQGNSGAADAMIRERDLAQLTKGLTNEDAAKITAQFDGNNMLRKQIADLQAAQAAATAAAQAQTQAADQARQAADQVRSAYQSITDSIFAEVARIRGLAIGDTQQSLIEAQAKFSITSAQARAGDQEAAKLLPSLSQALLTIAENQTSTLVDLNRIRGQTAGSLEETGTKIAGQFGLTVPRFADNSNNDALLKAVQLLEEKMAQMIQAQERGNEVNTSAAEALQGQQRRPLLVQVVA